MSGPPETPGELAPAEGARPPPAGRGAPSGSLEAKLDALPAGPGVYLFKDGSGRVIYVGKARGLRSRVGSYFRGGDGRVQVRFLVERVRDLECLVTRTEKEALILESNLIKQYRPRYNIRLKDDKSYVSVKITRQDAWPRVVVTRRILRDGAQYFGPFHSASSVRETIDVIRKAFPLRTCSDGVFRNRTRPCLEFQIKRCLGPCCLAVDRAEYEEYLRSAALLLEGKDTQLVDSLRERMQRSSAELRFEEAARLRDQIRAIERTAERQQMVVHGGGDQDVFGLYREGGFIEAQVLIVRGGRLTARQSFGFSDWELPDDEVLGALLGQFYQGGRVAPEEILLPVEIEDSSARADLWSERRGRRVRVVVPVRGDRRRLVELAIANARQGFLERRNAEDRFTRSAEELRDRLGLRALPRSVQCVDISTFQGSETVASVVTMIDGEPAPHLYRRFHVRTVTGTDDFASMREVLGRHLRRALDRGEVPDLLVIDGGRGQLGVAMAVCGDLGVEGMDVVGLAKLRVRPDARGAEVERVEERVFLPGRKNPVALPRNSSALFLLQRVRDEAHRFAITFHQRVRDRARLASPLEAIPGVGASRRRALMRAFGSLTRIRAASAGEIAEVQGIDRALASRIHAALRGDVSDDPGRSSPELPPG